MNDLLLVGEACGLVFLRLVLPVVIAEIALERFQDYLKGRN